MAVDPGRVGPDNLPGDSVSWGHSPFDPGAAVMFEVFAKNTLVPLLLRAGLAVIFLYHGLHKVGREAGMAWAGEGLPGWQQVLVAWGELLGGVALAVGFLTRTASLGLMVIMAGGHAHVHGPRGFR